MQVNIGYDNMVMSSKLVSILAPESALMRCPKDDAKERNILVDAAQGSIVITDSDHAILSAIHVETRAQGFFGGDAS
jgi:extracellular matrix regulatory protein A